MEKMKNYFSKRKKIVAAALCAASLVTAIGAAGVASAARPGPNNKADAVTSATTRAKQGGESGKTAVPAAVQSNIGESRAKEIALKHAGLAASQVGFEKAKLENEDGRAEYEIEFYSDEKEYEYTIDALNGNILEQEIDQRD